MLVFSAAAPVHADGGVVLKDVTSEVGINYARIASPDRAADRAELLSRAPVPSSALGGMLRESPQKWHGAPGVAIFDYDRDGDLDIYVPNGPGRANSLFANQLKQTGQLSFVDVAAAAGVELTAQDGSGVCYGDIDNDNDDDLYVLGTGDGNHLFENNGNGTFTNITQVAGVAGNNEYAASCAMGDVNQDGRLDIVVGTTYHTWNDRLTVFRPQYNEGSEHDLLFLNTGNNVFADVSTTSGVQNLADVPAPGSPPGLATATWAVSLVDYDQDGDVDYMGAEDAGPMPQEKRGVLRTLKNNGAGNFTDVTSAVGLSVTGGFMGFAYSDYNCDGNLDFFVTDLGGFMTAAQHSRWFLGEANGTFTYPGVGALGGTPFGWGTVAIDYDNDGDDDIYYQGGVDIVNILVHDNPGVLLRNTGNCTANFTWDIAGIERDHRDRIVEGVASGDLNNDGFDDVVSVSELDTPTALLFRWVGAVTGPRGTVFDNFAAFNPVLIPTAGGILIYNGGPAILDGGLSVEVNSADNGNQWAQVEVAGSVGLVSNPHAKGKVNRNGFGATMIFTPEGGKTIRRPVLGGSSYASQNSPINGFGLGAANKGTVEVLWPGGVRNRLYDVAAGERVKLPEIPCDFANFKPSLPGNGNAGRLGYSKCVKESLKDLTQQNVISQSFASRLEASALRAYDDAH